jgi:hypothetical protein
MQKNNAHNRFDKKDSLELGEHAERDFILLAVKSGWKISVSSKAENIDDHWDYLIEKENLIFKVEVKSVKRIDRHDPNAQINYIWVELQNVRGKVGWLFGKADLIAFEKDSAFIFVKRLDLLALINKKVDLVAKDALYKIYRRDRRKDKLTLLPMSDLEEIKFMEWRNS